MEISISTTAVISYVLFAIFGFVILKNITARSNMKRAAQTEKLVVYHKDTRKWVKIGRIICALMLIPVGIWAYSYLKDNPDGTIFESLGVFGVPALTCIYYAVGYTDSWDWIITEKGVFPMANGKNITWNELINCGMTNKALMKKEAKAAKGKHNYKIKEKDKNRKISVSIQIRKEKGEFLKVPMRFLGVGTQAEAEEYCNLIREFIHAQDRAKLYHKQKEERKVAIQKRKFYI